jgi:hypothetical protein
LRRTENTEPTLCRECNQEPADDDGFCSDSCSLAFDEGLAGNQDGQAEERAGWAVPPRALRQHYFAEGTSLCKEHGDPGGELENPEMAYLRQCATCFRRLDALVRRRAAARLEAAQ